MSNHTIFIIETMLVLFFCWSFRVHIKTAFIDFIKQIQLRNYLSGNERRKLATPNNSSLLVDHSNDQLIKDAYRSLSQVSFKRDKGKIVISIPTRNYPELQDYIQKKLSHYLMQWLENNYPNRHWTRAELNKKSLFGWEFIIREK